MSDKPHRACRLTLKLEGDTREEVSRALFNLSHMVDREELTTGCSGGIGSGCIYEYIEGASPTHDEYFAQLRAYLDAQSSCDASS